MATNLRLVAAGLISCSAAMALAQPVLTGLGAAPSGVSNPQSGTYYISGNNTRWTLNGGTLTYTTIGASGGGLISADGAYQTCSLPNNGAIVGLTASVLPAFGIPTGYSPFVLTPATDLMAARYTAATNSAAGLPGFPNDANSQTYQVFSSGDSGLVHNALNMSHNGRFIVVQGYVSTYNTSATSQAITNITSSGGVATVTTSAAHLMATGDQVTIASNSVAGYNGVQTITSVPTATTFTFTTGATGTGTAGSCTFAIGTRITASQNFRFRGGIWDAQTNVLRLLPTPFRTTTQTTRRRDGTAFAVSDDGAVVVGAQENGTAGTATSTDPDGARLLVYRWNGSDYVMSFLPDGVNASGFPIEYSVSAGTVWINSAGTMIVGPAVDNNSNLFIGKWVWNTGTSSWDPPINIAANINPNVSITSIDAGGVTTATPHGLSVNDWVYISGNSLAANNGPKQVINTENPTSFEFSGMAPGTGGTANKAPSWLPASVTSCTIAPTLTATGLSDDGNTIVGFTTYSTCGSFMRAGWIWTSTLGYAADWYDYLNGLGVAGLAPDGVSPFGPSGDNGDFSKGLPKLGNPTAISTDGSAIVGSQGGTQVIVGAPPWILLNSGGGGCVAPVITNNPTNATYARCSSGSTVSSVILNAAAAGTAPLSYRWYQGSTPLTDTTTTNGSVVTGSGSFQLRITSPNPIDTNGQYYCVVTGCNGTTATTTSATVVNDPAVPTVGDTCSAAITVSEGSTPFNICGCYLNDGYSTCAPTTELADVWFVYTPTFTGNARFQTCGTGWDTTLELLDGCGGSVLQCNNDVGARGLVGTTCSSTRSLISSYPVTTGVPIYVRVGSLASFMSATGSLSITHAPSPPANDLCTNATQVSIGTYPFDLSEATDDFTFGANFCNAAETSSTASNRDVWFHLVSPFGGTYTISTCGSTITNPILHVMADCSGSNILACSDNVGSGVTGCTSNQARVLNLTVSGSVLIRVAASGTSAPSSGLGNLVISGTPNTGCGSADFNCDGDVGTDSDIEAFFACLAGDCPAFPCTGSADFNGDGDVGTDSDIEAFFRVLSGGSC